MTQKWYKIPRCPTCNEAAVGVYEAVKVYGRGQRRYSRMYQTEPTLTVIPQTATPYNPNGRVRCGHCHKFRKDLRVVDGGLRFAQDEKDEEVDDG